MDATGWLIVAVGLVQFAVGLYAGWLAWGRGPRRLSWWKLRSLKREWKREYPAWEGKRQTQLGGQITDPVVLPPVSRRPGPPPQRKSVGRRGAAG